MTSPTSLDANLGRLIDRFHEVRSEKRQLTERLAEQGGHIHKLEAQCKALRQQLDEAGEDRFALKLLRDERKAIRRQLQAALTRIEHLERELLT